RQSALRLRLGHPGREPEPARARPAGSLRHAALVTHAGQRHGSGDVAAAGSGADVAAARARFGRSSRRIGVQDGGAVARARRAGAGRGVKIVLQKRDDSELTPMESAANAARSGRDDRKRRRAEIESLSDDQWGGDEEETEMATKSETIRKAAELDGDEKVEFVQ